MDKELIDRAWRILPAEFKRVVKAHYVGLNAAYKAYLSKDSLTNEECDRCNAMREKIVLYNMYFGHHNLTSDAEGEEMLTVPRKKVLYMYDFNEDILICDPTHNGAKLLKAKLQELFGSKCLPDEACNVASSDVASNVAGSKPKPAEPKFNYKVDDKVRVKGVNNYILCGKVGVIKKLPDEIEPFNYKIGFENDKYTYLSEEYLEPYTEPQPATECSNLNKESSTCTDDCSSPGKESSQMKPITSKVSVYLATAEEDEEFRQLLHENGFKWNTGDLLINSSCWSSVLEEDKIHYVHPDKTVTYYGDKSSDTLTFSEFKKQYFVANVNHRQNIVNCNKRFDNILKDCFSKERRLNIAAQFMSAMMSNPAIFHQHLNAEEEDYILYGSLEFADALIAECGKGGFK